MNFLRRSSAALIVYVCLSFGTTFAELSKTNAPKSSPSMETNIVEKAMALIRQHKFTEAHEFLLPIGERGDAEPQALLGQTYNAGWGVPVDYQRAFKWWSRAAEGGSTDGQWGLGCLYDEGHGVPRDSQMAAQWWKKAADAGNIKATVSLAFLYEEGRGVKPNLKESARLFGLAAEAGEPAAQLNYGLKILHGEGVQQNQLLGCAWLAVAAESPRTKGKHYAEKFSSQRDKSWGELSSADREKAEKLKKEIQSRIKAD
jgi:TPR repeat protein